MQSPVLLALAKDYIEVRAMLKQAMAILYDVEPAGAVNMCWSEAERIRKYLRETNQ